MPRTILSRKDKARSVKNVKRQDYLRYFIFKIKPNMKKTIAISK